MDLSFLGPSAAVVIVVLLFLKFLTSIGKGLVAALNALTKSNERVAKATEKGAREAKQRNGHLAELAVENNLNNQTMNKAILDAISNLSVQHVDKQVVEHQAVQGE
jgi:Sec-independent protein translocase protein TatA